MSVSSAVELSLILLIAFSLLEVSAALMLLSILSPYVILLLSGPIFFSAIILSGLLASVFTAAFVRQETPTITTAIAATTLTHFFFALNFIIFFTLFLMSDSPKAGSPALKSPVFVASFNNDVL